MVFCLKRPTREVDHGRSTIPWKVTLAFYTNTSPVLMCTLDTRVKRGTGELDVSDAVQGSNPGHPGCPSH